jgi:hypothetical protein
MRIQKRILKRGTECIRLKSLGLTQEEIVDDLKRRGLIHKAAKKDAVQYAIKKVEAYRDFKASKANKVNFNLKKLEPKKSQEPKRIPEPFEDVVNRILDDKSISLKKRVKAASVLLGVSQ